MQQDEYKIIGKIMAYYPVMDGITQEEQQFFSSWLQEGENKKLFDYIVNNERRKAQLDLWLNLVNTEEASREKYLAAVERELHKTKVTWWRRWPAYAAAASVILMLSIAGYLKFGGKKSGIENGTPSAVQANNIKPGGYKAKLTLDDGTVIILDSTIGKLVQQGNTYVTNKDGQLVYKKTGEAAKILFNTLSTAKGENYATVLSDGTKVWLNSQSFIRYPVAFSGDTRKVQVVGEAYFEVAPSKSLKGGKHGKLPFVVEATGMEVEVLGTHFNINSYQDEDAVKTTLLEGKVKVRSTTTKAELVLMPGEQARLNQQGKGLNKKKDVDVDAEVAWRSGYFQFNNADLNTVLKQLERWYDIEVVYKGVIFSDTFNGKISRSSNLQDVLNILEANQVHFSLQGNKLIVSP